MRALAWPVYSYAGNLLADSGYICFRNLIRAIPEWTWHLVVPDWATEENGKAIRDDLDDLPNVVKVPVPMPTLYRGQEVAADPATIWKYSPQMGSQPIDVAICGSNQTAAQLANAWTIRSQDDDRPFIVAWDLLTRDDNNKGWRSEDVELLMHFAGAAVADLNVYGSPMMEWMTKGMLRKFFTPSVIRDVTQNRSETIFAGVPVARIDQVTAGIKKRDKFTVFYGGRMGAVKRVDDLTEIADLAFQFGRDMEMVVCTGSMSPIKQAAFREQFPFVELHTGTGQEAAWRLMAECHAAIMWSKHEMIGSMFIEEMAHGLPLISYEHRWIQSLLPEEYPYWAKDARIAGAHLRTLYDAWKADPLNYDQDMDPWMQHVREQYDSANQSQVFRRTVEARVLPLIEKSHRDYAEGRSAALVEVAREALESGWADRPEDERISFADYLAQIQKIARTGKSFVGARLVSARSNSVLDAYRVALWLGYEDVGVDEPVFRRKVES